jgi:hypothetical protein
MMLQISNGLWAIKNKKAALHLRADAQKSKSLILAQGER